MTIKIEAKIHYMNGTDFFTRCKAEIEAFSPDGHKYYDYEYRTTFKAARKLLIKAAKKYFTYHLNSHKPPPDEMVEIEIEV